MPINNVKINCLLYFKVYFMIRWSISFLIIYDFKIVRYYNIVFKFGFWLTLDSVHLILISNSLQQLLDPTSLESSWLHVVHNTVFNLFLYRQSVWWQWKSLLSFLSAKWFCWLDGLSQVYVWVLVDIQRSSLKKIPSYILCYILFVHCTGTM